MKSRKPNYASPARRLRAGKASNYIKHIEALAVERPGLNVVLWERVSKPRQGRKQDNIGDQDKNLRQRASELGMKVISVFAHEGSGYGDESKTLLARAAAYAARHDAIVFAETTSRLMRHPAFHSKQWPNAQARESDLKFLPDFGVLATDLPPDASPSELRSYERRRGQRIKQRPGGRPVKPGYKKRIRLRMKTKAIKLHGRGWSLNEIANETGVPRSTIHRWVS
jgi:DNA invertase Pin-like site-specific DNA recombinase